MLLDPRAPADGVQRTPLQYVIRIIRYHLQRPHLCSRVCLDTEARLRLYVYRGRRCQEVVNNSSACILSLYHHQRCSLLYLEENEGRRDELVQTALLPQKRMPGTQIYEGLASPAP